MIKKCYFQGHELDKDKLAKELGDIMWYCALAADALNMNLDDIAQMNIDKLKARYPDGFNPENSRNRKKKND